MSNDNRILTRPGTLTADLVVMHRDPVAGIERSSIVVIKSSVGPGLGGTREGRWDSDADMLADNMRLAGGMGYKAVWNDLPYCGAKVCVELVPGARVEVVYETLGRLVASLRGAVITTEDSGTDPAKMGLMHRFAPGLVLGRPIEEGGTGDPSPITALGIASAIESTARILGHGSLEGVAVYVLGCGHVGTRLIRLLLDAGARVLASDLRPERLAPFAGRVEVVPVGAKVTADVFAPCALGGDVGFDFAHEVKAICGAANNQLATDEVADALHRRGVLYVPDWAANGGGLIAVAAEHLGRDRDWAANRARRIGDRVHDLLVMARQRHLPPLTVAYELCALANATSGRANPGEVSALSARSEA